MATDALRIGSGTLSDTSGNIDDAAVPADTKRFVKAITLCNTTTSEVTVTITVAGVTVISGYTIPGSGTDSDGIAKENTITIPFMDQIMDAGERITGSASTASAVDYYISGREVSTV